MKKINLIYWNEPNFGDAVSPLLIEELSGASVQYKEISLSRSQRLKALFTMDYEQLKISLFPWQKVLGCVGSILSWLPKGSQVWGSGFMNQDSKFRGGEIFAVRGKLTSDSLVKQGFQRCDVYGDPALLLPLWLKPSSKKQRFLGIIPHHSEVDYFIEKYSDKYFIIDLRTKNVHRIVEEINSCEYILSTSLHGVIVAHAYDIPALWIKKGYIGTDGFKFHDYFSSVKIPLYHGITDIDEILKNDSRVLELFDEYNDRSLLNVDLFSLQRNLLRSFPYQLKERYKSII